MPAGLSDIVNRGLGIPIAARKGKKENRVNCGEPRHACGQKEAHEPVRQKPFFAQRRNFRTADSTFVRQQKRRHDQIVVAWPSGVLVCSWSFSSASFSSASLL